MAKILLFFPELLKNQTPLLPPLELLTLTPGLTAAGYEVILRDERVQPGSIEMLEHDLKEVLFVGISCRPGGQVRRGFAFARAVKNINADIPVVFGGWFTTMFHNHVIAHPHVDYVVVGEGEGPVVALANALAGGVHAVNIPGVGHMKEGEYQYLPGETVSHIVDIPPPDYGALDLKPYLGNPRELTYISSKGCQAECRFCAIQSHYHSQWYALPPQRVVADICSLVKTYDLESVRIVDANFFGDESRVCSILEGLLASDLRIGWRAAGRIDTMLKFQPATWDLIRESGCYEIEVGAESGSERILKNMKKGVSPEQVDAFASQLSALKIPVTFNYILGYPGETVEDLKMTVSRIHSLKRRFPHHRFAIYRFSPIPGTALYDECDDNAWFGSRPRDIENSQIYRPSAAQNWLPDPVARIADMLFYCYLPFSLRLYTDGTKSSPGVLMSIAARVSKFRVDRFQFRLPVIWWLLRAGTRLGIFNSQRFRQWVCS